MTTQEALELASWLVAEGWVDEMSEDTVQQLAEEILKYWVSARQQSITVDGEQIPFRVV